MYTADASAKLPFSRRRAQADSVADQQGVNEAFASGFLRYGWLT